MSTHTPARTPAHTLRRALAILLAIRTRTHRDEKGDAITTAITASAETEKDENVALMRLADAVDGHLDPGEGLQRRDLELLTHDAGVSRAHIHEWCKHHDPDLADVASRFPSPAT